VHKKDLVEKKIISTFPRCLDEIMGSPLEFVESSPKNNRRSTNNVAAQVEERTNLP
jgi:hypothetical protein